MTFPDLRDAFPHAEPLHVNGQLTLTDPDFNPGCGYVSQEEASILYRVAQDFFGPWIEIGSHTGWSGAHIAHGCGELVMLEPQFCHVGFYQRTRENLQRAGVWNSVLPIAQNGHEYLAAGGAADICFAGAFIDGDHEPGMPLLDAIHVLGRMQERCAIVFHDAVGQPVVDAVGWVERQGFQVREYPTMARMVVCWRGEWTPC